MTWLRPLWRRHRHGGPTVDEIRREGFIALDLETTGLDSRRDSVVEVAAVLVAGDRPRGSYVTLVKPAASIPPDTGRIHGLTDAAVAAAPDIGAVIEALDAFVQDHLIVGHGIGFDMAVLARVRRAERRRPAKNPTLCTRRLAAALHPNWAEYDLDAIALRLGLGVVGRHTAEGDALAAATLFLALLDEAAGRRATTLADLTWLQDSASPR